MRQLDADVILDKLFSILLGSELLFIFTQDFPKEKMTNHSNLRMNKFSYKYFLNSMSTGVLQAHIQLIFSI